MYKTKEVTFQHEKFWISGDLIDLYYIYREDICI